MNAQIAQPDVMTVEAFEEYALLPENRDRRLEFINGRIVELVSTDYPSMIGLNIGSEIRMFVKANKLGRVTGADGGYWVMNERYIPDVGYISNARQPEPTYKAYNPLAPDLAVEVLSPTDSEADARDKVINYMLAGTVVWLVDPQKKTISIYVSGQKPQTLGVEDEIDGGDVLPGFRLKVAEIF
jgi:Uma2 family endonuclease